MRSLLVQASSVERAVEKAWATAGMPTEFTIKVHDFGKKGFLGMTKKPAIISIVYEPQKQTAISRAPKAQPRQPRQPRQTRPQQKQQRPIRPRPQLRPKVQPSAQAPLQPKPQPSAQAPLQPKTFWADTLIYDVTSWLTEITKTIGLPSSFKVRSDKKILTITFDRDVMAGQDEERLLFSGLSYLLIQFLKKKHKKKYQGYKLILTSKRFTNKSPQK